MGLFSSIRNSESIYEYTEDKIKKNYFLRKMVFVFSIFTRYIATKKYFFHFRFFTESSISKTAILLTTTFKKQLYNDIYKKAFLSLQTKAAMKFLLARTQLLVAIPYDEHVMWYCQSI